MLEKAISEGRKTLSEYESKQLLASYGVPVCKEQLALDIDQALKAAGEIGYPVAIKACDPGISHKTEQDLIRLDIRSEEELRTAFNDIVFRMTSNGKAVLVQEMVKGKRELMAGLTRDPQFGPCVMFGLGGIFTEILKDVSFRLAPIDHREALEMMKEIKSHKILDAIRGMEKVDLDAAAQILVAVGKIGIENEAVKEIDINPLVVRGGKPVAVDALVVLS
jgi:acetate---CoA ligase (ADP-forming) subunit beta